MNEHLIFGDGSDGDVILTHADEGTLTRDMQYRNLTVPSDFNFGGWRISVSETMTLTQPRVPNRTHADRRRILRARRLWLAYGGGPSRMDAHLIVDGTVRSTNRREHRRDAASAVEAARRGRRGSR